MVNSRYQRPPLVAQLCGSAAIRKTHRKPVRNDYFAYRSTEDIPVIRITMPGWGCFRFRSLDYDPQAGALGRRSQRGRWERENATPTTCPL